MRFALLSDSEHHLLCHILREGLRLGDLVNPATVALLTRLEHAPDARVPPPLVPAPGPPSSRGPRRSIVVVLNNANGFDALLLNCGHIVARHTRAGQAHTHCEACALCQPIGEG